MSSTATAETSERRMGRYALLGKIASGGMATVHLGRLAGEGGFSRVVAVKCMHHHLEGDPEFRAMFLDEARLAARIVHPNVVSTLDVGTSEEGMFLVTEYVVGESLAALVRLSAEAGERIPTAVALRIVIDTLNGLHAAHVATDDTGAALSIVHRDVSPQNIIVGTDGLSRVLDFGIAKAADRSHTTRDGQLKGKLRYMAPEQFRDAEVSAQTDVYAASVVLWELLTGERLFAGTNDAAVMARVLEGVVSRPSRLAREISPELDAIVERGLARDPRERFPSARAMAEALEAMSPAPTRQVGDWVERVAKDALRQRAAMIEGARAGEPVTSVDTDLSTRTSTLASDAPAHATPFEQTRTTVRPLTAPAERTEPLVFLPTPQRTGTTRATKLTLGGASLLAVLAVLAAIVAFVALRASHGSTDAPASSSSSPADRASTTSVVTAAMESPALTAAPRADEEAAPSAISARPTPRPPARPRKPPAKSTATQAASCNPPYYEDPSGIRRVKPQCL